jgi:hypothetical protein
MNVHIVVTDSDGTVYEGDAQLTASTGKPGAARRQPRRSKPTADSKIADMDLALPVRAFVNRYAKGLSGPRKFTLLVGRLCNGEVGTSVSAQAVERHWNSMKELMGGPYNPAYSTRSKNEGWVDTPERGKVVLLMDWKHALTSK